MCCKKLLWRPVPGHDHYAVSSTGVVRSLDRWVPLPRGRRLHTGKVLKPYRTPSGHLYVSLGRGERQLVHRIVALAFIGPAPAGCEVLHLDHNPANNHVGNLKYGTRSENLRHDYETGVQRRAKKVRVTFADGSSTVFKNGTRAASALGVSQPAVSLALKLGSTFRKMKAKVELV